MQAILAEKVASGRAAGSDSVEYGRFGPLAVQTAPPPLTRQAPIRVSLNPVAGQIWQRPFRLVRARRRCRLGSKRERLILVLAIGGDPLGTSVFGCRNMAIPVHGTTGAAGPGRWMWVGFLEDLP